MENTELLEGEVAQTEKIGLGDLVIVALIAAATFGLACYWEFPGLYPGVWSDAAVAAGIRPAAHVIPGYWTAVATLIYRFFGIDHGTEMMRLAGHIVLAGVAVSIYFVLREWLAFAMRMRPQLSRRRTLVMRVASALGAMALVSADPVWIAGQCLSHTTILLGFSLAAIECFFVFLRKGTLKYACLGALILGFLAAETPMGIILAILFIAVTVLVSKVMPNLASPFFRPEVLEVGKWHLTFLFLAAMLAGVVLNCYTFIEHGGVSAVGGTTGDIPFTYLYGYWNRIATAADFGGWILWFGICILPFVVTTINFPNSADEEQFLPYTSGLIFLFCGILVLSQSSCVPSLWFWTYLPMKSQYLLSMGLFCCAATLALSVTILGVDSLCRDHKRLALQAFGEGVEEDDEDDEEAPKPRRRTIRDDVNADFGSMTFFRRLGIIVIPIVILAVMFPDRAMPTTRTMLAIVDDFIAETLRETGDAKYVFTDGQFDDVLELEAFRAGQPLKCYSLMGGSKALDVYLRTRDITEKEDLFSFRFDTAMGLRSWIRDKPERLKASAVQMGFDLWKRDGKALPPMGGLLSRPAGFGDEAERQRGVKAAHALADRMLAVQKLPGGVKGCTDPIVRRAFFTAQWRVARTCLYRSEANDVRGLAEEAIADSKLAKTLNECNQIYLDLVASMERRLSQMMKTLTPREGLQLALVRADFTMGKTYAETILDSDPNNPDANFAMGMYFLQERQLSRAERFLLRCLIRKPNEPAVYNNLAMMQIELKKFDAARVNIEKALKLVPDSAAVLDTKRALEEAIANDGKPAKSPSKGK